MNLPKSQRAKIPSTINIKRSILFYIVGFDRELNYLCLRKIFGDFRRISIYCCSLSKTRENEPNHSIMQGCLPKKAGEQPFENSNKSYLANSTTLSHKKIVVISSWILINELRSTKHITSIFALIASCIVIAFQYLVRSAIFETTAFLVASILGYLIVYRWFPRWEY